MDDGNTTDAETAGVADAASAVFVKRDYHSPSESREHCAYVGRLHDAKDGDVQMYDVLNGKWDYDSNRNIPGLMERAGIQDGDEFEIVLRRTGNRPFGDRRVILQEPGRYAPETDAQMLFREENGRTWGHRTDGPCG